jgi:hypothetical protein
VAGRHDAGPTGESDGEGIPPPACLPDLREKLARLSDLLEVFDIQPQELDQQPQRIHTEMVIPIYISMKTEVAQACGSLWKDRERDDLWEKFQATAEKWPAYDAAASELKAIRDNGGTAVDALVRAEKPRRHYISALDKFVKACSQTIAYFFPA